jgi:hypothetical protein
MCEKRKEPCYRLFNIQSKGFLPNIISVLIADMASCKPYPFSNEYKYAFLSEPLIITSKLVLLPEDEITYNESEETANLYLQVAE